ncbi:MAG: xanthine dehydrogenase family protein molybdopterin-binding subunit [Deltaproteobacteria bacterium]|nr:xanthine dehydrogenase family protein molybdopterin-binding subunit [Deltaproteobacteria bacterium]
MDVPKRMEDLPTSSLRFVGRSVARVEDRSLVTGRTEFIDNVRLPGMLHCAILRSPYPHARITRVDTSAAQQLPGVVAVVTGEDALRWSFPTATVPEGWGTHCLATDKVRYVGEPVAAVAATSRYIAEDAAELIAVDYDQLPPVVDGLRALQPDSPRLFEQHRNNIMFQKLFTWGEVERAFRGADHVFSEKFRWHRVGANPMETFGVITEWDPVEGSVTCRGTFQSPSLIAVGRAAVLGLPLNKVRLISHQRGGSFGGKMGFRGTDISALLSRKAGGRPVKWIEDRMEYLVGGSGQAWDRFYEAAIAVKNDGTITGFKVKLVEDLGATGEGFSSLGAVKPLSCFTGCYTIPAAGYDLTLVATNKVPTTAYRGMGPPPHNFVLEQLIDIAARGIGLDPAEMRRRNFIAPDRFPYTIPSGNEYDSGNYEAALDTVLAMADYPGLRAEQAAARRQGRCVGISVVTAIEPGVFDWNAYAGVGMPGIGVPEGVTVSIDLFGKIVVRVGFTTEGQGQFTLASQLAAEYFGVALEDVRVVAQDTLSAPPHFGPGGSRLGVALTGAVLGACERVEAMLIKAAAHLMQVPPESVELMDGKLRVRGVPGAEMPVAQVAAVMRTRADLLPPGTEQSPEATYVWTPPGRTPIDDQGRAKSYLTAANACHVALVEVDPETGQVKILKYFIADDCGTRLNPATVEGMTDGGVAQGVGAALLEEYAYNEDGQPLTSTFMDYLLPTIFEAPRTEKKVLVTPSPFTPLGAKGAGEGAIHTTPAAILCAISDALAPLGVGVTEVPATPNRLWQLIRSAPR